MKQTSRHYDGALGQGETSLVGKRQEGAADAESGSALVLFDRRRGRRIYMWSALLLP
jgi:hypothetical protein